MKENRYIEIANVDSNTSKLTFNPNTGRITLKIGNNDRDNEEILKNMAFDLLTSDHEFEPFTYRGKIKFFNDGVNCVMETERKDFSYYISYKHSEIICAKFLGE